MTAEELEQLIKQFERQEEILPGSGSYPISVLNSMLTNLSQWGKLTPRQLEFVGSLKRRVQSPDELIAWKEEFLSKYKEKFDYIVRYYHENNIPYYSDTIMNALEQEDYIPSEINLTKVVKNKYSSRVIEEMLVKSPKFEEGDIVQVRKGYHRRDTAGRAYHNSYDIGNPVGRYWIEPEKDWNYIVVKNDKMPRNACIGCRRYELLPFGDSTIITIEQRYIKKARV